MDDETLGTDNFVLLKTYAAPGTKCVGLVGLHRRPSSRIADHVLPNALELLLTPLSKRPWMTSLSMISFSSISRTRGWMTSSANFLTVEVSY